MRIPRLRELLDHFKATRRGEVKVAPYGSRGRVYAPPEGERDLKRDMNAGNIIAVKGKPRARLSVRVFRKDGTIEDLGMVNSDARVREIVKNG